MLFYAFTSILVSVCLSVIFPQFSQSLLLVFHHILVYSFTYSLVFYCYLSVISSSALFSSYSSYSYILLTYFPSYVFYPISLQNYFSLSACHLYFILTVSSISPLLRASVVPTRPRLASCACWGRGGRGQRGVCVRACPAPPLTPRPP